MAVVIDYLPHRLYAANTLSVLRTRVDSHFHLRPERPRIRIINCQLSHPQLSAFGPVPRRPDDNSF